MTSSKEGHLWNSSGLKTGLITDSVIDGTPQREILESYDVIVIGTGFAGLVAARNLSRASNTKILLIDGRDRIGGRTWTAKSMGEEFEMGGTWVHWNQPHVYSEIHRYNLQGNLKTSAGTASAQSTTYTAAFSTPHNLDGGETSSATQRAADAFFSIDGLSSRDLMPYPHDPMRQPALWMKYDHLSAKDRLDQLDIPQIEKDLFDGMISSFGSAPGSHCGFTEVLRWYALGGHSMAGVFEHAGIFKLGKGGMTSLARSIISEYRGNLLLETTINAIEQDRDGVTLFAKNGRKFQASHVISTIPLNCLSDVKFTPPLSPLRQEAINAGHINQGAKIHFKLRQAEPGWFSMASGYGVSPWCFSFSDHNGTSTKNGTYCIGFGYNGHLKDPRASSDIVSSFKTHLKPDADVEAYLTHDWMNDPLAKGTWSCWGPGSMSKWLSELQKPHGRVLFASADWANGWRGFIDGAIERGVTAGMTAERLLSQDKAVCKL
ncbi:Ff.00g034910.m01.CDS01 [Fusarium sp. VM40]|nr:Ff.00g034910.m01.CDS01 [Fusarium sp. VM40]